MFFARFSDAGRRDTAFKTGFGGLWGGKSDGCALCLCEWHEKMGAVGVVRGFAPLSGMQKHGVEFRLNLAGEVFGGVLFA